MKRIEIKQGRVIDPVNNIDKIGALYISDGKIAAVFDKPQGFEADEIIDVKNAIVCPGFIDLSARLREPGQTQKATFRSETKAAASAGITSLCLPPDTAPVIDTPAVTKLIKDKAEAVGYSQIYPIGALTQGLDGKRLSAMLALKSAGCIAVSNANAPLKNLVILRRAMEYAAGHQLTLFYRPDEPSLSQQGCAHEGVFATHYGLPAIPEAAESIAVAQCLELAELTECRIHFSQISSRRAIIKIQQAQKYGLDVTADVAIHQLLLSEQDIEPFNSAYHVIPPFRAKEDKKYLQESLATGIVKAICSDHQPHDLDAKLGAFSETESGVSALETLLPLTLKLVEANVLSLSDALACLTLKPAEILGINAGTLTQGMPADICVFNPDELWQVNDKNWLSAGKNTPFWGQTLKGRVTHTFQKGQLIYTLEKSS
ncbi:MAG: dihydroorotase [Methylococcales bacterium]|nr:dihydroorotase [Methylococcales bacterium]